MARQIATGSKVKDAVASVGGGRSGDSGKLPTGYRWADAAQTRAEPIPGTKVAEETKSAKDKNSFYGSFDAVDKDKAFTAVADEFRRVLGDSADVKTLADTVLAEGPQTAREAELIMKPMVVREKSAQMAGQILRDARQGLDQATAETPQGRLYGAILQRVGAAGVSEAELKEALSDTLRTVGIRSGKEPEILALLGKRIDQLAVQKSEDAEDSRRRRANRFVGTDYDENAVPNNVMIDAIGRAVDWVTDPNTYTARPGDE